MPTRWSTLFISLLFKFCFVIKKGHFQIIDWTQLPTKKYYHRWLINVVCLLCDTLIQRFKVYCQKKKSHTQNTRTHNQLSWSWVAFFPITERQITLKQRELNQGVLKHNQTYCWQFLRWSYTLWPRYLGPQFVHLRILRCPPCLQILWDSHVLPRMQHELARWREIWREFLLEDF